MSGFADCACAKCSPPAQEAPKAAPVCQAATGNCPDAPKTRVILDYIRKNPIRVEWCDPCALAYERAHVTSASTGKPYAGPERLPRPQLAADWVEDCLPEGDR